uniref:VP18.8 protein n=1 Tax=Suid herpesvirus 1 TaxID=10345 RepID=A0A455R6X2_SUHV|nr:VP18.8 protein [Suid alphaherpesvirus 1]
MAAGGGGGGVSRTALARPPIHRGTSAPCGDGDGDEASRLLGRAQPREAPYLIPRPDGDLAVPDDLQYATFDLTGDPVAVGAGSYGSVLVYGSVAVKTLRAGFGHEAVMTLLAAEATRSAGVRGVVRLVGLSAPLRQLVFPAYEMDMDAYRRSLTARPGHVVHALGRVFTELGRALVFLNSRGLSHLDVKGGNIFVRTCGNMVVTAVIGDFSLMALNSRSTLADPRFRLARRKALKLTSLARSPPTGVLLGHARDRPTGVLMDFINGRPPPPGPLPHEVGLAIDLCALGHVLLDVALGLRPQRGQTLTREYAVEVLARRCVLFAALLPPGSGPAAEALAEDILEEELAASFRECVASSRPGNQPPRTVAPLLELVARFCGEDGGARFAELAA